MEETGGSTRKVKSRVKPIKKGVTGKGKKKMVEQEESDRELEEEGEEEVEEEEEDAWARSFSLENDEAKEDLESDLEADTISSLALHSSTITTSNPASKTKKPIAKNVLNSLNFTSSKSSVTTIKTTPIKKSRTKKVTSISNPVEKTKRVSSGILKDEDDIDVDRVLAQYRAKLAKKDEKEVKEKKSIYLVISDSD